MINNRIMRPSVQNTIATVCNLKVMLGVFNNGFVSEVQARTVMDP